MAATHRARPRETVSEIMRRVRSTNTTPEISLRHALFQTGLRYRVHVKRLPGCPDIVFPTARVAVFVDGDFWHGRQWQARGLPSLASQFREEQADYWVPKINRNVERDRRVDKELRGLGWTVVRVWESDIRRDTPSCVDRIRSKLLRSRRRTI